ncbi:hypothetical protein DFH07DRAFT_940535 [Mycena maculata]|uniref:Uncharacterized protein n=1 Tax=Mycena maculata TaxID=230809 RepID=A0AAD7NEB1_9AGAR|nr:hypothetical protein DFH07DRAFT_940535 [Mycena maculata]
MSATWNGVGHPDHCHLRAQYYTSFDGYARMALTPVAVPVLTQKMMSLMMLMVLVRKRSGVIPVREV